MKQILASFVILALLLGGCAGPKPTPEAVAYDTLQQASNVITAKHLLFEVAVSEGKVPVEKEREVRTAYVAAQRSIATTARALSGGLSANTPEDVDRLVAAFLALVTTIVPPNTN